MHDPAFFDVDLDVLSCQPGHFGGEDERRAGFVEIDRRIPAGRIGADQLSDLFVQREEVAERDPSA